MWSIIFGSDVSDDNDDDDDDTSYFIEANKITGRTEPIICKDIAWITSSKLKNNNKDDALFSMDMNLQTIKAGLAFNFGSCHNVKVRSLYWTESLCSLASKIDVTQDEIFERIRQAQQV
jgi:hypothetical protein